MIFRQSGCSRTRAVFLALGEAARIADDIGVVEGVAGLLSR